ncbi:amidohydrolase family protein [Citricoccus sp.]|uniref:amidohydrolase family protein n=1 Tax=Citricoccus sp. TaxID=1978372 RepID=UPI0028BF2934|nr:amidohydrolase family protein [Citricoccus sp.]
MSGPVVDVHAHVLLPQLQELVAGIDPEGWQEAQDLELRRNGADSQAASGAMIRERWGLLTDLPARLAAMDAAAVDHQVVSPSPSHYYPFLAPDHAVSVARRANEEIRDLVAQDPQRLSGLGLSPLQHPSRMVETLRHAVVECGLRGVEIGSYGPGVGGGQHGTVELSDPSLEPFWAAARELGAVVFLHPFGCSLDERLDRFYLANTVSQPAENAVALSHLIFSGVLDRYPDLIVIAAHGGGYLPAAIGRSDRAWAVRPEARGCQHPPSHYLRRLWFDSLTHDAGQLAALVSAAGADRVLLGSDFPFDMGSERPVQEVLDAGLGQAAEAAVLSGNAADLGLGPEPRLRP